MDKEPLLISQSMVKSMLSYLDGLECGLAIDAQYNGGHFGISSPVQKLGQYFEYQFSGALPKDGTIPEAVRTKKGELTSKYVIMEKQVLNLKKAFDFYGIKRLHAGKRLKHRGLVGDLDIIGQATKDITIYDHETGDVVKVIPAGTILVIDLKSSGLLDNFYDPFGWHLNSLANKDKIITQAVHYKLLGYYEYGVEVPFMFFVHANTNDIDYKIIEIEVDENTSASHLEKCNDVRKLFEIEKKAGWKAHPSVTRCAKCFLNKYCSSRQEVEKVYSIKV